MLKTNSTSPQTLVPMHRPFLSGQGNAASFPIAHKNCFSTKNSRSLRLLRRASTGVKAVLTSTEKSTSVKAVITVLQTVGGALTHLGLSRGLDDIADLLGKSLLIELVAAELDPILTIIDIFSCGHLLKESGVEKPTIKSYARRTRKHENEIYFESSFEIPEDFGEVGAIVIENEHHKELYVKNIVLDGFLYGPADVTCNSWIHPKFDNPHDRVFFLNKSYLPSQTPSGLKKHRENELIILRGDGQGERKKGERIYDYDVYNDLGDPDSSEDLARPVLGGPEHPYPRRCRTGRPRTKKDSLSEKRSSSVYVPRDEEFSEVKQMTFSAKTVYSVLHALVPSLETIVDGNEGFPHFTAIDTLFNEGFEIDVPKAGFLGNIIPRIVRAISDTGKNVLRFETPEMIDRDKFAWFRDTEFARQTLAGVNPCCIKLVTEWPLKSKLDPEVYGPAESAITKEMALEEKKLFVLDYHDVFMPYVNKVRELKGTTLYGSRALFFLTPAGTLRPLAIELVRPPVNGKPQWKQVFKPCWDATGVWLWRLAKAHLLAHDSGYHQLVSHWLRTHCCTEPYVIATNRQLSTMHPIYRLLHPHLRYTMEINALAREALINADGIIESSFSPGKYSLELSSVAYDQLWQFDLEALPADLINRGMAVEDPTAPHGLNLTIEDYPYASDGLLIWDAIKQWVTDYVGVYYPEASLIQSDNELQEWWTEIRTVGHGDKKNEPWWPELKTPEDLIGILTTIIWVASGHHAAVNFGQFDFAGYFPNRPTIARTPFPLEDPDDSGKERFLERPEEFLLQCFPSQLQATKVLTILDVLSNHSPDEEYIGEEIQPCWAEDKIINAAFERFSGRLKEIEGIIDARNANTNLRNRTGAGVVSYELLKPYSEAGVTGKDPSFVNFHQVLKRRPTIVGVSFRPKASMLQFEEAQAPPPNPSAKPIGPSSAQVRPAVTSAGSVRRQLRIEASILFVSPVSKFSLPGVNFDDQLARTNTVANISKVTNLAAAQHHNIALLYFDAPSASQNCSLLRLVTSDIGSWSLALLRSLLT
ncbi:hypothetical protein BUALT_Bualt02G0189500 [Buddleja alternifolia]|uniref:Lipoxygenase n=1 Tax=Buddleja alternifolia TaxID=168488 RepID=A0AAV6YCG5_9LAMI|nr:hypothetical protein BUALT_Bualt02G0189500 [Buddleja alternifolia]